MKGQKVFANCHLNITLRSTFGDYLTPDEYFNTHQLDIVFDFSVLPFAYLSSRFILTTNIFSLPTYIVNYTSSNNSEKART